MVGVIVGVRVMVGDNVIVGTEAVAVRAASAVSLPMGIKLLCCSRTTRKSANPSRHTNIPITLLTI